MGLRTGQVSGVVVLDDDTIDGSAVVSLELPRTVTVITGSGKPHYYFKAPAIKVVARSRKCGQIPTRTRVSCIRMSDTPPRI